MLPTPVRLGQALPCRPQPVRRATQDCTPPPIKVLGVELGSAKRLRILMDFVRAQLLLRSSGASLVCDLGSCQRLDGDGTSVWSATAGRHRRGRSRGRPRIRGVRHHHLALRYRRGARPVHYFIESCHNQTGLFFTQPQTSACVRWRVCASSSVPGRSILVSLQLHHDPARTQVPSRPLRS